MKKGTFKIKKDRTCEYCNSNFYISGSKFANHVRWCKDNPNLDMVKYRENFRNGIKVGHDKRYGKLIFRVVNCNYCGSYMIVSEREKHFKIKHYCTKTCANTRSHSEETKRKIRKSTSISIKKLWQTNPDYAKKVLSHNPRFTSKGECELRNYFIDNFPSEEWTFGGWLKYNDVSGIIRDLYSPKLKICIEYDGIWHFEDIVGQLESKQLKDQALEDWCIHNDWKLIRIKDEVFQIDSVGWCKRIHEEVETGKDLIVKFY